MEPMLKVTDLSVSYGHVEALRGVSIQVEQGQIVSIIGANGAGKSTLLRTISGLVKPLNGRVEFLGEPLPKKPNKIVAKGIVHVPEGRKTFSGLTIRDNLLVGGYLFKGKELEKDLQDQYKLFPILEERKNQYAGTLSGGEQTRVMLSALFAREDAYPLIDEPTNSLDAPGRAMLADYLRRKDGFLLVSHDRAFLNRAIDHVVCLNKANTYVMQGNYDTFEARLNGENEAEAARNETLRKEIKQLEAAARKRRNGAIARRKTSATRISPFMGK